MRHSLRWWPLRGLLVFAGLLFCAWLLMPILSVVSAQAPKAPQPKLLLEEATKKELVDGDLKGAIDTYQRILKLDGVPRAVVAKSLLHMGQCYEKLGNAEARKAYERLVREFADQPDEANAARGRLAAMQQPAGSTGRSEMTVRRVWEGPGVDLSGGASRNGAYLTFEEWPSEGLAIHDLATGENRLLTKPGAEPGFVYFSRPSPDGKQVAYSWYKYGSTDGVCELRTVGLDGSGPRVLYRSTGKEWPYPTDWSPDGRNILAVFPQKGGDQIVLVSVNDGSVRVLRTVERGYDGRPRFSPDSRYVAFDAAPGSGSGQHDVFLLPLDSGREVPLVEHQADDSVLDWTPDGKGILFLSDRTGTPGAWLIQVRDGQPRGTPELVKSDLPPYPKPLGFTRQGSYYYGVRIPSSDVYVAELDPATGNVSTPAVPATQRFTGSNNTPDWSPDGGRLVFLSHVGSTGGWEIRALCLRSTGTGEVRDLAAKLNRINWVRWFPDNRSLLVGGNPNPDEFGIYRIETETGEFTRVSDMSLGWPAIPSRDGKAIFRLKAYQEPRRTSIVQRDLETGKERELHSVNLKVRALLQSAMALSPDGQQLAFVIREEQSGTKVLQILQTASGEVRDLLRGSETPFPASVAWMPDGRSVLFLKQPDSKDPTTELWLAPVQGGEPRKLGLAARDMRELCIHPDGRHVAFTSAEGRSEVWVMENFLHPAK